jgi:hypothetical protein
MSEHRNELDTQGLSIFIEKNELFRCLLRHQEDVRNNGVENEQFCFSRDAFQLMFILYMSLIFGGAFWSWVVGYFNTLLTAWYFTVALK